VKKAAQTFKMCT